MEERTTINIVVANEVSREG